MLCTGRQVGKSEACAKDAGDYSVENKNKIVVMIAPLERQAYGLFEKTLSYLMENFPKMLVLKGKKKPTKEKIELINGTKIFCLPVGMQGLSVRFLTIDRLYVDEASRMPESVWVAVEPALLTTGGDTIMTSTPFGTQGKFYQAWINEDGLYDSFTRFSISSEKVIAERPLTATWTEKVREKALLKLAQAKKRMDSRLYAQEYLGEFIEAFNRFFSNELIRKCCVLSRPNGIQQNKAYFLGVDIARMGDDESTFEILDRTNRERIVQVESIITAKTLTTDTIQKIINLNKLYNFRKIYIDAGAGSLGVGVLDHLLQEKSTKGKVIAVNNRAQSLDRDDNHKQKLMKEDLYFNLRMLMEQGKLWLLDDEEIIESLASVQYEYKEDGRIEIISNYNHPVEGLTRAAYCAKDKSLKLWAR